MLEEKQGVTEETVRSSSKKRNIHQHLLDNCNDVRCEKIWELDEPAGVEF